jgi:hypothetical protein
MENTPGAYACAVTDVKPVAPLRSSPDQVQVAETIVQPVGAVALSENVATWLDVEPAGGVA